MIDFKKETPLSPCELAQKIKVEFGIDRHVSTVRSWIENGVKGVCLEGRKVGGELVTSYEAYLRFDAQLNGDSE